MLSKEYQNTAHTLRRVAQNMTDQTIVDRLEVLAKDYERRAEKASLTLWLWLDRPTAVSAREARRNKCGLGWTTCRTTRSSLS
jgi:hypothetical protein